MSHASRRFVSLLTLIGFCLVFGPRSSWAIIETTAGNFNVAFDVSASKPEVTRGSATFITARIKNLSTVAIAGSELVVTVPNGFTLIDSASRLDDAVVSSTSGSSRVFSIGALAPGTNKILGFLLVASSAVQVGKRYEVSFFLRNNTGAAQSATRRVVITVVSDPVFDEGIIVGKVFDDRNANAVQDQGEQGVPGVKLATEEGIVVVTDPYGRYHIPALKPGRHVVKLDGHTLPKSTKFVTEEAVLIKSTDGMFHVVNFAVLLPEPQIPKKYRDQLSVVVTQGADLVKPELAIDLNHPVLRMGLGYFEEDPVFYIRTNYADLVSAWRIEIRDEFGDEVWTGFGLGAPPTQAPWDGRTTSQEVISGGVYSFRLIVRDAEGHEDWTPLGYFRVVSKLKKNMPDDPKINVPAVGNMSIDRDGKQSISLVSKPRVLVRGKTVPWNTISVNGESVGVNLDGSFQTEFFAPPGNREVVVTTTDREGNSVSYQEEVELKDSMFFMVGLGEEELGFNVMDGNVEVVGRENTFHDGFYEDGRLAFYLKGKIKGKFLIESRYDTDDTRRDLFTNLDPDAYYPVYGDHSEIRYDAYDTKQRFYILVEMDRSYVKWGSFNTNFTDTELSTHNRTFSGLKVYHETLATTRYGDAKRGVVVYTADVDHFADHDEFLGTNGRSFRLRNRFVIEGSEKIRMEIRDAIQGITIYSRPFEQGTDYEIDYAGGRVLLTHPLSAHSPSDPIISNDILHGSETYLIVDYEFDPQGSTSDRNNGLRGFMHLGDHLRVGATAIEDKRPDGDYDLRGLDLVGKFGRNTKVVAEYARSQRRTMRNAVSFDGGITFADINTGNTIIKKASRIFDDAYLVKAQTKFRTGTEVSGYAQQVNAGFANSDSILQAGKRKAGLEVRQKVGEFVQLGYRYDVQKATDSNNRAGVFLTSPEESTVHDVQVKADYDEYLGIMEYRHQNINPFPGQYRSFTNALDDVHFGNAFAVKAGYRVTPNMMPYVKGQVTQGGDGPNHQLGGGVEAKVMGGKGTVQLEEMVGNTGDSTELSFNVATSEGSEVYSKLRTGPRLDGTGQGMSTTIGSSSQVNSRSRFYSEREYSSYQDGERSASILGYETQLTDRWNVDSSFERSQIRDISEVNSHRNALAFEVSYLDLDAVKNVARVDLMIDNGATNRFQWLFHDTFDWKLSPDTQFSARLKRSDSYEWGDGGIRTDASSTEVNFGLAYRPIDQDRWNALARYTWLNEISATSQFDTPDLFGIEVDESAHILAAEFGYKLLPPRLDLAEKFAYRRTALEARKDTFYIGQFLWANRFNFHVIRKWDLILEYRLLWDFELLDSFKHGVVAELDREIMNYVHFGLGYNFTHFADDLNSLNDISRNGFFTRVSGKF
ncbi:MAG: hypothetical protein A3A73_00050 [Omnitrophica bacterium RIFCSPLOWO2_01_FULL_50_24]|nr:MAG: hypothetical protein A3A73_00050 [Omnitrophica bacterium RIFCSPLOWO2_01_FULL_50_24]